MPAQLKLAWFHLIICVATALAYLSLLPFVGPARAMAALGLIGFTGFAPLFFRRRKGGDVVCDERDQIIQLRSLSAAWAILWLFLATVSMSAWFLHRDGTMPSSILPLMVFVAWFFAQLTQAVTTLMQYRTMGG